MFLRVSIPDSSGDAMAGIDGYIPTRPDPVYGGQLQDLSLPGQPAEYRLRIDYDEISVELSDGESAILRAPSYTAAELGLRPAASEGHAESPCRALK